MVGQCASLQGAAGVGRVVPGSATVHRRAVGFSPATRAGDAQLPDLPARPEHDGSWPHWTVRASRGREAGSMKPAVEWVSSPIGRAGLAFEAAGEGVAQRDDLERRREHELTRVQDNGSPSEHPPRRQLVRRTGRVDVRVEVVVEDPKSRSAVRRCWTVAPTRARTAQASGPRFDLRDEVASESTLGDGILRTLYVRLRMASCLIRRREPRLAGRSVPSCSNMPRSGSLATVGPAAAVHRSRRS